MNTSHTLSSWIGKFKQIAAVALAIGILSSAGHAEEGTWKTAFFKRGFVGELKGPLGTIARMRTPLGFGGTKVRMYVRGTNQQEVDLDKMALVKGADDTGTISGAPFPILFGGQQSFKLEKTGGLNTAVSDDVAIPVTPGTWYVEDEYSSAFPYAYEVDHGYQETGDAFAKPTLSGTVNCRTGMVYRVDVFTTDPRSSIVCYGDSITAGYNSTPDTDHRYPAILGKLLNRPVLNLGVNGDTAQESGAAGYLINELTGVDTVIYLMGINDIIGAGKINSVTSYANMVQTFISICHHGQKKVYIGTIPPAGGFAPFDSDPAKEVLRKAFNAWIRQSSGADGVIDFDAAMADPANPGKLRADCQSDWIHPNDLGYQRMAEAAAKVLGGK